jgi:hypothetical protein
MPMTSSTASATRRSPTRRVTKRVNAGGVSSPNSAPASATGVGTPRMRQTPRTNDGIPAQGSTGSGRIVSTTSARSSAHDRRRARHTSMSDDRSARAVAAPARSDPGTPCAVTTMIDPHPAARCLAGRSSRRSGRTARAFNCTECTERGRGAIWPDVGAGPQTVFELRLATRVSRSVSCDLCLALGRLRSVATASNGAGARRSNRRAAASQPRAPRGHLPKPRPDRLQGAWHSPCTHDPLTWKEVSCHEPDHPFAFDDR